jgi:hypothetical protein
MSNGVEIPPEEEKPSEVLRFEVVLERRVIVYAPTIVEASLRAQQVDGVAGRYAVVSCVEVGLSAKDERAPLIDGAPPRETQK